MRKSLSALMILCLCIVAAAAQEKPKEQASKPPTVSQVLDRQLSSLEEEFVSLAEAMPEDKFEFVPANGEFKGVRTFGRQIRHVAATNFVIAAGLLQEKPPFDPKLDDGPAEIKTRAETLKFMKDSFAQAHKAIATLNEKNLTEMVPNPWNPEGRMARLGLGSIFTWHGFDHYGQMVVYLRMNGLIPPASRPQ